MPPSHTFRAIFLYLCESLLPFLLYAHRKIVQWYINSNNLSSQLLTIIFFFFFFNSCHSFTQCLIICYNLCYVVFISLYFATFTVDEYKIQKRVKKKKKKKMKKGEEVVFLILATLTFLQKRKKRNKKDREFFFYFFRDIIFRDYDYFYY